MRIALDVHAHVAPAHPTVALDLAGVEYQDGALVIDGHRVGLADLYRPDRLVAWLDDHDIAHAMISIPPPFYRQQLGAAESYAWAEYLNMCLRATAYDHVLRMTPLFHLPIEHPAVALALLEELVTQARFKGVALAAGGLEGIDYADPALDPIWRMLDAAQAFVFLHPGQCCDRRLAPFYLENLLGNPYETAVAATQLVMAGVPGRYPGLRFCLAHAGGLFPAVVGRLERGFVTARPGVPTNVERPLVAARRFSSDSIAHHPAALALARDVFGPGNVIFGSDWPFPMGQDPNEVAKKSESGTSDEGEL